MCVPPRLLWQEVPCRATVFAGGEKRERLEVVGRNPRPSEIERRLFVAKRAADFFCRLRLLSSIEASARFALKGEDHLRRAGAHLAVKRRSLSPTRRRREEAG